MDMSGSPSRTQAWAAGAHLYSGRPDPTWPLSLVQAEKLIRIWEGLEPIGEAPLAATRIGYRGCFASDGTGRVWLVRDGVAIQTAPGSSTVRKDTAREFERAILASAPPGLLPEDLT